MSESRISDDGPANEPWDTVVFSLTNGFVWVAWPGASGAVKLGKYEPVRAMMQDFLDQSTIGERLGGINTSD